MNVAIVRFHHLVAVAVLAAGTTAAAQTITVDTSSDVIDFGGARRVEDLPGPDGKVSLREAGLASDNTPGVQTIAFNVPQDEWQFQWLYPGRVVLTPFLGFRVQDTAIIDATTQTAFTGDTNPDGGEVVVWNTASITDLSMVGVGGEVRGFDGTDIAVSGSLNVIQGNTMSNVTVGGSSSNLIGGTAVGEGNTGGTIKIDGADDTTIVGNTFQRVRVWSATGTRIGGPNPEERNYITGYGTWNSEGLPGGTTVQLFNTTDTVIENNWIGTTPDGMEQGSLASVIGIGFEGENNNTLIRDNRIAGILGHGRSPHHSGQFFGRAILVAGDGAGLTIVGNTIGLNAEGAPVLGSVWGIDVGNPVTHPSRITDIRIGGTLPGEGNVVAGHRFNGITIGHDVPQVRISGTTFYANDALGIDLIPTGYGYGVSPNDPLDLDTGGNGLQNFPELASAVQEGSSVRIIGTLHSSPLNDFTIELFASPACDASGFGEGRVFLGATDASTDASGDAAFDALLPVVLPAGWAITSTATLEPVGATSEFSSCLPLETGAVLPSGFTAVYGAYQSGSVEDLHASDDRYVRIEQRPAFTPLLPLIRLEVDGVAPFDDPAQLLVTIEAAASSIPTLPPQKLLLRDYDAASWELVDERPATSSDSTVEVVIDVDAGRFIANAGGAVKLRVDWFDPGDVFFPLWGSRTDLALWDLVP